MVYLLHIFPRCEGITAVINEELMISEEKKIELHVNNVPLNINRPLCNYKKKSKVAVRIIDYILFIEIILVNTIEKY